MARAPVLIQAKDSSGLSWAFLRAGAHNVIGALWEVSDVSTPQLMDEFYGELEKGKAPDAALRNAKLSLLHSERIPQTVLLGSISALHGIVISF